MKARLTAIILTVFIIAAGFAACGKTDAGEKRVQDLNYEESTEEISNPDQGFYRPLYVKINENGATYNKGVINSQTQLYHLRCDISAFSAEVNNVADKLVTDEALEGLDALLFYLKENDKNAIVRFAYDPGYNGSADKEPSLDVMLGHVGSICSVLNRYVNTVTAIETGLIGPWGEMHTSAAAFVADIGEIAVKDELEFNVEHGLESGKYDVYLRIYGEELQNAPLYCVKFANAGLWNAELKANKIGSFERVFA